MSTRVVITGIGAVTPLGVGAETLHERAVAGLSGLNDENENGLGGKVGPMRLSRRRAGAADCRAMRGASPAISAPLSAGWTPSKRSIW